MKSNQTREKILDASLELFNEKKASNVSTVQISTAMKISPGNLYYYYANKEEVIRCIWKERIAENLKVILDKAGKIKTAADLLDYIKECVKHIMKYDFFYTEMPTLFTNDNELVRLCGDLTTRIIHSLSGLYDAWKQSGNVIDLAEASRVLMIENCISLFHQIAVSCDIAQRAKENTDALMENAYLRMAAFLQPYFTDTMNQEMKDELRKRGIGENGYVKPIAFA